MTGIKECILYRDFEQGEILEKMTELIQDVDHPKVLYGKAGTYFSCIHELVEMAGSYGFSGNLWHNYLTFLLVNNENAFSTACEIVGPVEGSINELAKHDFAIFKELFDFDLKKCETNIRLRNEKACIFPISARTGEGISELAEKITEHVRERLAEGEEK